MSQTEPKFDETGLIPAVVQDTRTGEVRMVAWMNREALAATLETGHATFFSRSRGRLWVKGESSGHTLDVASLHLDCDADTVLVRATPRGPTCHTGRPTCFFRQLGPDGLTDTEAPPANFLSALEHEIARRVGSTGEKSYTRSLLDGGATKIGAKLREEANELAIALAEETPERVANEAADVLYHLMVGLRLRGVTLEQVLEVLASRQGVSGLQEKANRPPKPD